MLALPFFLVIHESQILVISSQLDFILAAVVGSTVGLEFQSTPSLASNRICNQVILGLNGILLWITDYTFRTIDPYSRRLCLEKNRQSSPLFWKSRLFLASCGATPPLFALGPGTSFLPPPPKISLLSSSFKVTFL